VAREVEARRRGPSADGRRRTANSLIASVPEQGLFPNPASLPLHP
jgi:hypothetical protein